MFFSGSGTTRAVAELVGEGVASGGAEVLVVEIQGEEIVEGRWSNDAALESLDQCEAIIFGSPTYMGCVSAQLKAFFDATVPRWYAQAWNGKLGAAFTVSAKPSGDKLNCLQDISTFAMQMGMIWVGTGVGMDAQFSQNGFYLGLGATSFSPDNITEEDQTTARHLGKRVAETCQRLGS
ncbi:MAG: NAD(P)H dehydrogenase (quinone) [Limisphaerales bacterium]